VTERVWLPLESHLLGFWVLVEIRGRYLVRWNAIGKAYMPIRGGKMDNFCLEENVV
jgi:hypothetical protein